MAVKIRTQELKDQSSILKQVAQQQRQHARNVWSKSEASMSKILPEQAQGALTPEMRTLYEKTMVNADMLDKHASHAYFVAETYEQAESALIERADGLPTQYGMARNSFRPVHMM